MARIREANCPTTLPHSSLPLNFSDGLSNRDFENIDRLRLIVIDLQLKNTQEKI